MSDDQLTPVELNWAQSVYKSLGWTLKDIKDAERENIAAVKEKENKEIIAATAKSKAEDDKKIGAAVTEATTERITQESDEKLKDVKVELVELKADVKDHFVHDNDDTDSDAMGVLVTQIKQLLNRLNTVYGNKTDFTNFPSEAVAFEKSNDTAKAFIQAAALEVKTKDTEGAQHNLLDAESAINDMQTLWQGVKAAAQTQPTEAPIPADLKPLVLEVSQGIKLMTGIGFAGSAIRLASS